MRIVVGLTTDVEAPAPGEAAGRYFLRESYVEAVRVAGGIALLLPHAPDAPSVEAYLDLIDALVVTGGAFDVPAELYGESSGKGMGELKPGRTEFESAIMRGAVARKLPLLGVCGGMQLLNVIYAGTLHQDIERELPGAAPHEQPHDKRRPQHEVEVTPGSLLSRITGERARLWVNSTHHQAVKTPGEGLNVTGRAPDGVIEAIEDPAAAFVVGVQWHPELLAASQPEQQAVYDGLIEAARSRRPA